MTLMESTDVCPLKKYSLCDAFDTHQMIDDLQF